MGEGLISLGRENCVLWDIEVNRKVKCEDIYVKKVDKEKFKLCTNYPHMNQHILSWLSLNLWRFIYNSYYKLQRYIIVRLMLT